MTYLTRSDFLALLALQADFWSCSRPDAYRTMRDLCKIAPTPKGKIS